MKPCLEKDQFQTDVRVIAEVQLRRFTQADTREQGFITKTAEFSAGLFYVLTVKRIDLVPKMPPAFIA